MIKLTSTARFLIGILLLAGFVAACAPAEQRRTVGTYVDDRAIAARINTEMARDPVTKATQVSVESFRGVVQLNGFVDSQEAISRAEEIARNIEGVQEVQNNLVVREERPRQ
jgi:hyperosmotically inducible periplasmic protein